MMVPIMVHTVKVWSITPARYVVIARGVRRVSVDGIRGYQSVLSTIGLN